MDFCAAPTIKRPRGGELDFEGKLTKACRVELKDCRVELPSDDDMDLGCEGNLTKACRVELKNCKVDLPSNDDMDLDCEVMDSQVVDSGFIHSLS